MVISEIVRPFVMDLLINVNFKPKGGGLSCRISKPKGVDDEIMWNNREERTSGGGAYVLTVLS